MVTAELAAVDFVDYPQEIVGRVLAAQVEIFAALREAEQSSTQQRPTQDAGIPRALPFYL